MISGRKKYVEMKYVQWIGNHYYLTYFEWEICQVEDKIILNDRGNLKIDKYCILLPTVYSEGEEEDKKYTLITSDWDTINMETGLQVPEYNPITIF